ncbi:unnamed protein product [Notodromas monacha]|uniref:E3 ubiquitin-protein ligase TM129 n=1 Tax=Notodromas monacha TaxID=399045 RepID=A0A7R9GD72_9CRUS|nr:unnamed protein product [Notodromas monacha]CAG0916862.1 unnamed protein product [Notodromas monacha]
MSLLLVYSVLYALVCVCLLYPPTEFVSSGLTVEGVFSRWLGDPTTDFIGYQVRRAALKRIFVAFMPFGYFALALKLFHEGFYLPIDVSGVGMAVGWDTMALLCAVCLAFFLTYCCFVFTESLVGDWDWTPIAKTLEDFAGPGENWRVVASRINSEVARADNYTTDPRCPIRVVVTENWIIQVNLFGLDVACQENAVFTLHSSNDFAISHHHVLGIQFLNLVVSCEGHNRKSFVVRIPSTDFEPLSLRLRRQIQNADSIPIAKSPLDKFMHTFKEWAGRNPRVEYAGELEPCVGCMERPAEVKLVRRCLEENVRSVDVEYNGQFLRLSTCVRCQCRPMWCIDCMSKWFIARQDADRPGTWLTSRAPCPTCRSPFCLRDVCYLASRVPAE